MGLEVNAQKCEVTYLGGQENANSGNGERPTRTDEEPAIRGESPTPNTSGVARVDDNTNPQPDPQSFFDVAGTTPLNKLFILGAPIHAHGHKQSLSAIEEVTKTLISRTANIGSHAALFFLSRYAAVPRATYLMRAAPIYTAQETLQAIDELMRDATSRCCNVQLDDDSWTQASLPLRYGGLGVRRLTDVALPAYIASVDSSRDLVCTINRRPNGDRPARLDPAIEAFTATQCPNFEPNPDHAHNHGLPQRLLDDYASSHRWDALLARANQLDRARLLAAASPHSGAWLSAVPIECLGLLLPDEAVRTNVALRLGSKVQQPRRCRCGQMSDALGHHSLSCNKNLGRLPRHAALNDVVYRALAAAGLVAILEPRGLDRGDGRRPDGITAYPFRRGRMLAWDATCVNTFASTHAMNCASVAGAAAIEAERRKRQHYAALAERYEFVPLAVETTGVLGPSFRDLLKDIGRMISQRSGEPRETAWLRQRVSLAVARGNAVAICGART